MSEKVKKLFNEISTSYDTLNHLLSMNIDKKWRTKTIRSILAPQDKSLLALDLCCGTFDLSLAFLKAYPNSRMIGADFSEAMLLAGQKKIEPYANRFTSLCADALDLPFEDNFFDVILCGYGFRNLDDSAKGLSEMKRVLKPGGQVLILDFFKPEKVFSKLFHKTYGHFVIPRVGGWISKKREAYQYLQDSIKNFLSVGACLSLMEKTGFTRTNSSDLMMGVSSLVTGVKP